MIKKNKGIGNLKSTLEKISSSGFLSKIMGKKKQLGRKIQEKIAKQQEKSSVRTSLAVDIGSSSIKVVQFSKIKGISVLDTFGEIALGPFVDKEIGEPVSLDPETLVRALDIILDASGADSDVVSYCVSPNHSFIYSFSYNKENDEKKNLTENILEQIRKRYAIETSEYDIEYDKIKNQYDDDSVIEYEVRGIKKEVIEKDDYISKKLELKKHLLKTEAKSILYAINHVFPKDYLIIDIGAATTKVYIIKQDKVYDYKIIKAGSHDIIDEFNFDKRSSSMDDTQFVGSTINSLFSSQLAQSLENKEKSKTMDMVISEIHDFLKEFEVVHKKFITDVALTGGGALFSELEEYISKALDRDVYIADPFSKVKNPNFANEKLKEVGPEYAAAIGLALESLNN